jgi:hypothetical protein
MFAILLLLLSLLVTNVTGQSISQSGLLFFDLSTGNISTSTSLTVAGSIVSTSNSILDDGSGDAFLAGALYVGGINANSASKLVSGGTALTFQLPTTSGTLALVSGASAAITGTSLTISHNTVLGSVAGATVATDKSILDDGTGSAFIFNDLYVGGVTAGAATKLVGGTAGTTITLPSTSGTLLVAGAGSNLQGSTLTITTSSALGGTASTTLSTLDDGTGTALFGNSIYIGSKTAGSATKLVQGAAGTVLTLPSTTGTLALATAPLNYFLGYGSTVGATATILQGAASAGMTITSGSVNVPQGVYALVVSVTGNCTLGDNIVLSPVVTNLGFFGYSESVMPCVDVGGVTTVTTTMNTGLSSPAGGGSFYVSVAGYNLILADGVYIQLQQLP